MRLLLLDTLGRLVQAGRTLLLDAAGASSSGTTTQPSAVARFETRYWDGAADQVVNLDLQGKRDATSSWLDLAGGDLRVGVGKVSGPSLLGTAGVYDGADTSAGNRVYSAANPPPSAPMLGLQVQKDVGLGNASQAIQASTFTVLTFPSQSRNDFGIAWDGGALFTVPADGYYLAMLRVRLPDTMANGTSVGVGVGTTAADNADLNWQTKGPTRGHVDVQHTRYYTAGTVIRAFMFSDVAVTIGVAYYQVTQLKGPKGDQGLAAAPKTTLYVGTPAGIGNIVGDQAVNGVTVPAFTYPTVQTATMTNFQIISIATDSFDSDLRAAVAGSAPALVVRTRQYGNGSVGSVATFRLVPAGTSMVWQIVMYRSNGSGSASSVADGTLNRLEVLVQASS